MYNTWLLGNVNMAPIMIIEKKWYVNEIETSFFNTHLLYIMDISRLIEF